MSVFAFALLQFMWCTIMSDSGLISLDNCSAEQDIPRRQDKNGYNRFHDYEWKLITTERMEELIQKGNQRYSNKISTQNNTIFVAENYFNIIEICTWKLQTSI